MRSLYWKIFISFWLATILIILTTAWITSHITRESSLSAHEQLFMDSYANAAIATFEAGKKNALRQWLEQIGMSRHMRIFLVSSNGEIIGSGSVPETVEDIGKNFGRNTLYEGIFKTGNFIVSHTILSQKGISYRLIALSNKPLIQFIQIPWTGLTIRLIVAIFSSGLICYLLSLYLTRPLRSLRIAAKLIAKGKLNTRVGKLTGHQKDEIGELSKDFNQMAARLEKILLSKERLLQDISHELRSPLARISIALELARRKTGKLAETENDRIEMEVERLNTLIGEILAFARLNKSINKLDLESVDIADLLSSIIEDANFEYSQDQSRKKVIFTEKMSCIALIDKRLVHRAIENIVRNALRYTEENSAVEILLECHPNEKQVHILIKDKGPGIPEDQLEKVFTPFYRVDSSREKKTGGYGLGLAIALEAIKLHKGTITARNRKDKGLAVSIIIPLSDKVSNLA